MDETSLCESTAFMPLPHSILQHTIQRISSACHFQLTAHREMCSSQSTYFISTWGDNSCSLVYANIHAQLTAVEQCLGRFSCFRKLERLIIQGSWPWVTCANIQMCEGLITSNWWLMGEEFQSASVCRSTELGQYSKVVQRERERDSADDYPASEELSKFVYRTCFIPEVTISAFWNRRWSVAAARFQEGVHESLTFPAG